jgi:hypothetical protein
MIAGSLEPDDVSTAARRASAPFNAKTTKFEPKI